MKLRSTLVLAGLATSLGVGGLGSVALASYQGDCSDAKPASVYTDGLEHYAGACAGGAFVQVNELGQPGGQPLVEVGTGVQEIDEGGIPPLGGGGENACQSVVYTNGLNHRAGVCIDDTHKVEVQEIAGSLAGDNPLVSGDLGVASFSVGLVVEDGTINPKVEITPGG